MRLILLLIFTLPVCIITKSCRTKESPKKKIVYVNSYHTGHPSSDEIQESVLGSFPADSFEVRYHIMDTKRNPSPEYISDRAAGIHDSIITFNPDILIVSDDNAVKYLVEPYFTGGDIPVVFCGVNTSAGQYDLPPDKITGMLEILPLEDALELVRSYYPDADELLVLTENTTTSRKEQELLDTMFNRLNLSVSYEMVNDFGSWKSVFAEANEKYDMIYVVTNGAIDGWDHEEAVSVIKNHIKIPLFTCEDFMMPYVVFGVTKIAAEQGTWAAQTAKQILRGAGPENIPVTRNKQAVTWLNYDLADRIGFIPDSSLIEKARMVNY